MTPLTPGGGTFDPDTIALMRTCLDDAWAELSPLIQARTMKSVLAQRILQAVAAGERDPVRLRTIALLHALNPTKPAPRG
jgi:hypothetical protein